MAGRKNGRSKRKSKKSSAMARRLAGNLHNFKRVEYESNINVTTDAVTGQYFGAQEFKLSDLSDYNCFTELFDTYRILGVNFQMIPITNAYTSASQLVQYILAADYDDASVPTSIEKMLNRAGSKLRQFTKPTSKYIKPAIATTVYDPGIVSSYGQKRNMWLDSQDANIPHFGIKWAFQGSPGQSITYQLKVTYYVQFKQPLQR